MICFHISGAFYEGMEWEDFVSDGRKLVTIEAVSGLGPIQSLHELDPDDDCYNALVSPSLTMESAKVALAAICGVTPGEIEIVEDRVCMAVNEFTLP